MSGINQHAVLGRIGKIETRFTSVGEPVVNMSLAVSETWTDKNSGQKQEKTDWINVVVFGKPAEIINQYAQKGEKIYIQGKVVTRKYNDQQGIEKYSTSTIVDGFNGKFELLGCNYSADNQQNNNQSKPNQQTQNQQQQNNQNQPAQQQQNQQTQQQNNQLHQQNKPFVDSDEIPF